MNFFSVLTVGSVFVNTIQEDQILDEQIQILEEHFYLFCITRFGVTLQATLGLYFNKVFKLPRTS